MVDETEQQDQKYLFIGNQHWLDFVNTEVAVQGQRVDLLDSFSALCAWLTAAGVFDAPEIERVKKTWGNDARASHALEQARVLRSVLRELADQITHGNPVPGRAVAVINEVLRHRMGYSELVATADGFERRVRGEISAPEHLLAPIAESVTDFLCQSDWTLLKHCENAACVLYFYDTTKNHTRRWCSMSGCGNRMKAAAHYRRVKAAKERAEDETGGQKRV